MRLTANPTKMHCMRITKVNKNTQQQKGETKKQIKNN